MTFCNPLHPAVEPAGHCDDLAVILGNMRRIIRCAFACLLFCGAVPLLASAREGPLTVDEKLRNAGLLTTDEQGARRCTAISFLEGRHIGSIDDDDGAFFDRSACFMKLAAATLNEKYCRDVVPHPVAMVFQRDTPLSEQRCLQYTRQLKASKLAPIEAIVSTPRVGPEQLRKIVGIRSSLQRDGSIVLEVELDKKPDSPAADYAVSQRFVSTPLNSPVAQSYPGDAPPLGRAATRVSINNYDDDYRLRVRDSFQLIRVNPAEDTLRFRLPPQDSPLNGLPGHQRTHLEPEWSWVLRLELVRALPAYADPSRRDGYITEASHDLHSIVDQLKIPQHDGILGPVASARLVAIEAQKEADAKRFKLRLRFTPVSSDSTYAISLTADSDLLRSGINLLPQNGDLHAENVMIRGEIPYAPISHYFLHLKKGQDTAVLSIDFGENNQDWLKKDPAIVLKARMQFIRTDDNKILDIRMPERYISESRIGLFPVYFP